MIYQFPKRKEPRQHAAPALLALLDYLQEEARRAGFSEASALMEMAALSISDASSPVIA